MKRFPFIAAVALVSAATFAQVYKLSVTKTDGQTIVIPTDDISKIEFIEEITGDPTLSASAQSDCVPFIGGPVTFKVSANCQWSYTVDNSQVSEVSKTKNQLVLDFPFKPSSDDVKYTVTFRYGDDKSQQLVIAQAATPTADLLDIVFKEDGTAEDASPMAHEVITRPSTALMTYYNDVHHRYVANYRHTLGEGITAGYYRVNYEAGDEFISRIADGCTFESIMMLGDADPANLEVKWFSSMQAGGIGFILPAHNKSKAITFLPNISTYGSSNWCWTHSNVIPEVGKYYHVVGVWNKEEGKTYIYINGKFGGSANTPGNFVPVSKGAESFVIGGDSEPNQTSAASAWNGDIVTARIYDRPMTADQVARLWEAAAFDESAKSLAITGLQYMPQCNVAPGFKYNIYGTGFETGDAVEMQKTDGSAVLNPSASVADGKLSIVIPDDMTSGSYKIILRRGASSVPLCSAEFIMSPATAAPVVPKIIAHRGAHTDGASENSLAALRKAMDADYYGIELDIWTTTDNKLIVHHDGEVNGLVFYQNTYDKIKNVRLSNGEYLPTFDSFVDAFKEKMETSSSKLIIEIKTHLTTERNRSAIDNVMKTVEEAGIKDRVEYIAFSFDNCKYILSKQPDAIVGYLMGDRAPADVLNAGIPSIDYSSGAYANHPEWIKEARDLGMIVNVWTINSSGDILKFIGQGVDYITTDAPALATELSEKNFIEQ